MRTRKTTTLCVSLPSPLVEELRHQAERLGISVSAVVTMRISAYSLVQSREEAQENGNT